jgi:hypothetical protein
MQAGGDDIMGEVKKFRTPALVKISGDGERKETADKEILILNKEILILNKEI